MSKPKGKGLFGRLDIAGRIILKWTLCKYVVLWFQLAQD